jgi:hypothetical protein
LLAQGKKNIEKFSAAFDFGSAHQLAVGNYFLEGSKVCYGNLVK